MEQLDGEPLDNETTDDNAWESPEAISEVMQEVPGGMSRDSGRDVRRTQHQYEGFADPDGYARSTGDDTE